MLVEAFPQVLEAVPEAGLVLLGGGPEHETLIARAGELGIAHAVHFTGFVHSAAPYIRLADLVVLPSRREGLPVAALEALALERAVVATAVGGTPDVVRPDETGWLVPLRAARRPGRRDRRGAPRPGRVRPTRGRGPRARGRRLLHARDDRPHRGALRGGRRHAPASGAAPAYLAARAYQRARLARPRLAPPTWNGVRILGYHRIAAAPDSLSVSPERFREQMRAVAESGAEPIRLDHALELMRRPVSGRYVCVTFDDGYRDNLLEAAPVLKEFGIPGTIYLPSRIIDGEVPFHWYDDPPPALSWDEVGELVAGGLVDVQSHTLTHPLLPQVDPQRARAEIVESKREIEAHVPYALTSFCYPAGLYGPREVELVRAAGYAAAVTTNPGVNAGGSELLELRRTLVYGADDARAFKGKLDGLLDSETVIQRALQARRSRAA